MTFPFVPVLDGIIQDLEKCHLYFMVHTSVFRDRSLFKCQVGGGRGGGQLQI